MLTNFLNSSNALWFWIAGGALLLTMEIIAPGAFLLWLGLAAGLTGLSLIFVQLDMGLQFTLFAALALALCLFARLVLRYGVTVTDRGTLNKAGNRFTGQIVIVAEAISNGRGKVKIGDTLWIAEGPDAAAGAQVRVTGSRGTVMVTELLG